jgi:hypothetical protein
MHGLQITLHARPFASVLLLGVALAAAPEVPANQVVLPGSVQVSTLGRARDPAAAFNSIDGTWLVVWIESEVGAPQNGLILGRIVRQDRTFATAPFVIGGGVALVPPRTAHEPLRNEWMVVYGAGPTFEPGPLRILARKVSSAGALIGTADALISAGGLGETACDVAAAQSVNTTTPGPPTPFFIAVWQQNFGANPGIVALRLSDDPSTPSHINFTPSPFQVDSDASFPGGRRSTRPRITELAPTVAGSGPGGLLRSESFHRVVFEVETDGQKDIYLVGINHTAVRATVRITQTPLIETTPVVAYNPLTLRTMVLFERGSGVQGQLLGAGDFGLLNLLGSDFAVSTGIAPSVVLQRTTDVFFASAEDATRLGLGCIAGRRVVGTPSLGTGTGSTQPVLSPSTAGGVLLGFLRSNTDGTKVIRASIVDPLPAISNNAPVALAGSDLEVAEGAIFDLDGTTSFDPDGDPLRHQWSRTDGGSPGDFFVGPEERSKAMPRLQAPMLGQDLEPIALAFQLAVDDFRLSPPFGPTDAVTVTVVPGADLNPPVARAGADRAVDEGQSVQLDGSASSDVDGDPLSFSWTVAGIAPPVIPPASVALAGASSASPSFTAPRFGQPGGIDIRLRLGVTTPRGGQGEDEVVIHVHDTINEPPVADAGPNQTVNEAAVVQLNGSGSSDPNGDAITHHWEVTSTLSFIGDVSETVEISDANAPSPTLIANIFSERDIALRITVRDSLGAEDTDELVLRVRTVPMQVLSVSPMSGSPGTRVTIQGINLFDPGTRVFFGQNDLTHQGIIEDIDDTTIVVLVPSGGPSHLRSLPIHSKMGAMVAIDYRDVVSAPVTVRKGAESFVTSQPFEVSHMEIFDAYLSQGLEAYPLIRKKDTLLQLRVRVGPGPQAPLPAYTSSTCTVFPSDGSPSWQIRNDPPPPPAPPPQPRFALAATATVTSMNDAVNFFLAGPSVTAPAYRFDARIYQNGVEVAAFRTEANSAPFTPVHPVRILGVKIVPFKDGSVDPAFDVERPTMQADLDAGLIAFRRIHPIPEAELVFWPDEVEMSQIIQDDGKVHLEPFGFSTNFLINQVGAFNTLIDTLESWNNLNPGQPASIVVGFVAASLQYPNTATGVAVSPKEMMADIARFSLTKDIGVVGDLLNSIFGIVEDALCIATLGLYCKDPIDILIDLIIGLFEVGTPYDVTGKVSLVIIQQNRTGHTFAHEVGHNMGFVNPNDPEHDADNISHSKYDEDSMSLTFFSAGGVTSPVFNVVSGQERIFHGTNLAKATMAYAPDTSNFNSFFEPRQYRRIFQAFRADGGGAGAAMMPARGRGGADGPAFHVSGWYAIRAGALELGDARPAAPSELLTTSPPVSLLTLAFLGPGGQVLADGGMTFSMILPSDVYEGGEPEDPDRDVVLLFSATHAIPAGATGVELRYRGATLWSRSALGVAPQVEITYPAGGENVPPGEEVLVRWTATDADGDELRHSLFLSLDGGATFMPLAVSLRGTEHRWSTRAAAGSDRAVIKVVASDGFHSGESSSGEFRLGGGSISASLLSPESGAALVSSRPIVLRGSARAPGGADVTDEATLRWSLASVEPAVDLGTGRSLLASPLAPGSHRIRLEVELAGQTASAEVEVDILLDSDGDGVGDAAESAAGLDPDDPQDLFLDGDGDGLTDGAEVLDFDSDPGLADTDGDGIPDGEEVPRFTSPTAADTDGDGITDDIDNCPITPNVDQADGDGDGAGDACETEDESGGEFRRGDFDGSEDVVITDAIAILGYLFLGSQTPSCLDAADADDSGDVEITDALRILNYLFLGGVAIPAPGPASCGLDPTGDLLQCADGGSCS